MKIKKIIYQVIRIPLIVIFIKTPLIRILKNRFKKNQLKNKSLLGRFLDYFFTKECYAQLKDPEEIRKLTDSSLTEGEGRKWAEHYYNKHFQTLEKLEKIKDGNMDHSEANPIFTKIINHIKSNKLENDKNCHIIQIGSCSGRDIEFFCKLFPNINYISTDINDEILNFQKEKYNYKNFNFYKCHAEDIDKCFEKYDLKYKKVIIFTESALQYVAPYFIEVFFNKLNLLKDLNLFILETVDSRFFKKNINKSQHTGNISFSHPYRKYAENFTILDDKVLKPYSSNDPLHKFTLNYYLHLRI